MAFLGADTDELREVGQEFQEGKETTDQVITYLKALIAILKAASFFSGGASLAYAEYLETTVVPWLEKISMALGMFAKVLNGQAQAQDDASDGNVDYASVPSYTSQSGNLPAPIQPYQGEPIVGGNAPVATTPDAGSTGTAPTSTPTTSTGPSLTIGENGHLMIDTGIDLDGEQPAASATTPAATTPGTQLGTHAVPEMRAVETTDARIPGGDPNNGASASGPAGANSGHTGVGHTGVTPSPLGSGSVDSGSGSGSGSDASGASHASPVSHAGPVADGGLGGATPGSEALGHTGMSEASPATAPSSESPSYGAAAGIAGGAAALGLGGAALAAKSGTTSSGGDAAIDALAANNGRGSSGAEVEQLQERLTAAGYDTQGTDGKWGPNTQAAYDAYRGEHPLPVVAGQGFTSPDGFDYHRIEGLAASSHVTPEFLRDVEGVAQRTGAKPEHLLAAMSFETGGSFDPAKVNSASGATGLIQFTGPAAQDLHITKAELGQMSAREQLPYVEQYLNQHRQGQPLNSMEKVYTTVLYGHPASGGEVMFSEGTKSYSQNSGLDANHDGRITVDEAVTRATRQIH